ncbi:hypothetical protein V6N11_082629 [Hibiscus sabdariffa]|uniref:Thioredoxin domain-containing protein n=1 Tax=Hibiscus sabdariffa TaxID=183260 RepID=A0ABR2P9M3_9ROSI
MENLEKEASVLNPNSQRPKNSNIGKTCIPGFVVESIDVVVVDIAIAIRWRSRERTGVKVVRVHLEVLDRFQAGFPTWPSRLKWSSTLELDGTETEPTALDAAVVILPAFCKLSNKFPKLSFVYADTDECPETTQHIRYTPTFHFYRDGERANEMFGAGEEGL